MGMQDVGPCPFCGEDEVEVQCSFVEREATPQDMGKPGEWYARIHCENANCFAAGPIAMGWFASSQDAITEAIWKWRAWPLSLAATKAIHKVMDESVDLPDDVAPPDTFPPPL